MIILEIIGAVLGIILFVRMWNFYKYGARYYEREEEKQGGGEQKPLVDEYGDPSFLGGLKSWLL